MKVFYSKRLAHNSKVFAIGILILAVILINTYLLFGGTNSRFGEKSFAEEGILASDDSFVNSDEQATEGAYGDGEIALMLEEDSIAATDGAQNNSANAADVGAWSSIGNERYYFYKDGTQAVGTVTINGAVLSFDKSGAWVSTRLDVPYISQYPDMPYACEAVSATMMINYAGVNISKEEFVSNMSYSADPNQGFTGSLYYVGQDGLGGVVYPSGILTLVKSYINSAVDLTGSTWAKVCSYLDVGKPVCVWITTAALDHTVVVTGHSKDQVWINDPQAGKDISMGLSQFMYYWQSNGYRALSY